MKNILKVLNIIGINNFAEYNSSQEEPRIQSFTGQTFLIKF